MLFSFWFANLYTAYLEGSPCRLCRKKPLLYFWVAPFCSHWQGLHCMQVGLQLGEMALPCGFNARRFLLTYRLSIRPHPCLPHYCINVAFIVKGRCTLRMVVIFQTSTETNFWDVEAHKLQPMSPQDSLSLSAPLIACLPLIATLPYFQASAKILCMDKARSYEEK